MSDSKRLKDYEAIGRGANKAAARGDMSLQILHLTDAILLLFEETRQTNVLLSEMLRRDDEN